MKKIFYAAAVACLLVSCENKSDISSNDEINQKKIGSESQNFARIASTDLSEQLEAVDLEYTDLFFDLGVNGITKTKTNGVDSFDFVTEKGFIFRGLPYDFKDFHFTVDNNELILGDIKITYKQGIPYLVRGSIIIKVDDVTDHIIDTDINTMAILLAFDEIMSSDPKSDFANYSSRMLATRPCAWWNTMTVMGIGATSGGAEADLYNATIQAANDGTLHNCVSLGGITETNLGFVKIARQSFCCP